MGYREQRIDYLNDQKASKIVARCGLERAKMRQPTDAEYERVCRIHAGFPRDRIEVSERSGGIWLKLDGRQKLLDETPQRRETKDPRTQVFGAGDTTTVTSNPDGSPYVFRSGSREEQKAELKAAIRANIKDLPTDVGINIHY